MCVVACFVKHSPRPLIDVREEAVICRRAAAPVGELLVRKPKKTEASQKTTNTTLTTAIPHAKTPPRRPIAFPGCNDVGREASCLGCLWLFAAGGEKAKSWK
jgi:hypothetical protein